MGGEDCDSAAICNNWLREKMNPMAEVVFVHGDGVDDFTGIA